MLRRFALVIALLAVACTACAHIGNARTDFVRNLSVLVDPQGTETIATVSQAARARDFIAAPYGFSAGYTRKVHWLRFTLTAPPPDTEGRRRLFVEFYPTYLDDLQVFIPQPDGQGFRRYAHGDRLPFSARRIPDRAFVQRVDFPDDRPMLVYVRLQTASSSVVAIRALTPERFLADTATEYTFLGIFFGVLFAGLLASLRYGFSGDPLQRAFLIHLTTTLFMLLGNNGLLGEYLFPNAPIWADRFTSVGTILVVISGTFFYGIALDMAHAAAWMRNLYRAVLGFGILCLPSPFLGFSMQAQRALILGAVLVVTIGVWRSVQLYRRNTLGSVLILLSLACSLLGASAATLTILGVLPGQFWLINSFKLSTLGTLACLQAYLMLHARMAAAGLIEARIEVSRAAAVLETERVARQAQNRFLAMLTHELRTPLSALRLCLGQISRSGRLRDHAENAIEQIDSVIERCDLACRVDDGRLQIVKAPCCLHEIVADLVMQWGAGGRIALDLPQDPPILLQTDPILLRAILENLIGNALKYSPVQASVRVCASLQPQAGRHGVRIRVENPVSGPSMRPDPEQVFTKYYRAPQAQRTTGSGLGLYIVRGLSMMLGGDARYLSDQPDVVFEAWIPA